MARRQTMGARLREARLALGLSLQGLADKIKREFGAEIGTSTIREAEQDKFLNPGIKTIEMIALGVELSPLEIIALHLDDPPPETKQRFTRSKWAMAAELYERLPPHRQVWFDDLIEMVIERMRKG